MPDAARPNPLADLAGELDSGPTMDQFVTLAQRVEELEDRIRSLAVNDFDTLRKVVLANQTSIRKLKSPRAWAKAASARLFRRSPS